MDYLFYLQDFKILIAQIYALCGGNLQAESQLIIFGNGQLLLTNEWITRLCPFPLPTFSIFEDNCLKWRINSCTISLARNIPPEKLTSNKTVQWCRPNWKIGKNVKIPGEHTRTRVADTFMCRPGWTLLEITFAFRWPKSEVLLNFPLIHLLLLLTPVSQYTLLGMA